MNVHQLKGKFELDGCVILRNFLNPEELAELDTRTEAYLARGYRAKMLEQKVFRGTLKNLNGDDEWFADMLVKGRPAKTVSQLLGDDLDPATAAFFDRIPGEEIAIRPHFDAIGHRRYGATIWIALDETTEANGCLFYAKGTHKRKFDHTVGLPNFDESTEGAFAVELKPGDAAVHSSLTIHWSYPNRTTHSRRGVSFFYWAASSKGEPQEAKSI